MKLHSLWWECELLISWVKFSAVLSWLTLITCLGMAFFCAELYFAFSTFHTAVRFKETPLPFRWLSLTPFIHLTSATYYTQIDAIITKMPWKFLIFLIAARPVGDERWRRQHITYMYAVWCMAQSRSRWGIKTFSWGDNEYKKE